MQILRPEAVWTPDGIREGMAIGIDSDGILRLDPSARHCSENEVSLPGRLLLPGMVDAHSHAFQRAFRGHVQWRASGRDDFWSWRDRMYAVANRLDPEGVEAVSALTFLELAEAGVTWVGEFHYLHHAPDGRPYDDPDELAHRVIAAALRVGIRITLLRVAYVRGGPGQALRADQIRFGDPSADGAIEAAQRLSAHADPRVTAGLAAHSVRALGRDDLARCAEWPGVIHAHVSEQPGENAACREEHGCTPVQLLDDVGLIRQGFTAVHLTFPEGDDLDRMRRAGAGVCVCPTTELDLGDGIFPVDGLDLRLSIGSDSHAVAAPLLEARSIELHARAVAGRRNVMAPPDDRHGLSERLLEIATLGGARALGGRGEGIVDGAPADLVAVDLRRPSAEGVPPLEAAALVSTPEWVDRVWVAGREIVSGGRHPDRDAIVSAARPHLGG